VCQTFIPTIPLDASSFALWIHQSLPSFCSKIEEVADAVDHLCRADIMRTDDDIVEPELVVGELS
jgi:cell cycle checkpoint protein